MPTTIQSLFKFPQLWPHLLFMVDLFISASQVHAQSIVEMSLRSLYLGFSSAVPHGMGLLEELGHSSAVVLIFSSCWLLHCGTIIQRVPLRTCIF